MKTKDRIPISPTQELREIRDKVSDEIKDMTYAELKEYLSERNALHPIMEKKDTEKNNENET